MLSHFFSPFFVPDRETLLGPGAKKDDMFSQARKVSQKTDLENSIERSVLVTPSELVFTKCMIYSSCLKLTEANKQVYKPD